MTTTTHNNSISKLLKEKRFDLSVSLTDLLAQELDKLRWKTQKMEGTVFLLRKKLELLEKEIEEKNNIRRKQDI